MTSCCYDVLLCGFISVLSRRTAAAAAAAVISYRFTSWMNFDKLILLSILL